MEPTKLWRPELIQKIINESAYRSMQTWSAHTISRIMPSLKRVLASVALAALWHASSCLTDEYPPPIPSLGDLGPVRDPAPCKDPETSKYYVFGTGQGITIRTSPDLQHWDLIGEVFPNGAPWADPYNNASSNLWAPDCTIENGT